MSIQQKFGSYTGLPGYLCKHTDPGSADHSLVALWRMPQSLQDQHLFVLLRPLTQTLEALPQPNLFRRLCLAAG